MTGQATMAEDYEKILIQLANGPRSLDDLHRTTGLSYRDLNKLVLDLRFSGRVAADEVRIKGQGKVKQYSLKLQV